jgi:hypothetical protein
VEYHCERTLLSASVFGIQKTLNLSPNWETAEGKISSLLAIKLQLRPD